MPEGPVAVLRTEDPAARLFELFLSRIARLARV